MQRVPPAMVTVVLAEEALARRCTGSIQAMSWVSDARHSEVAEYDMVRGSEAIELYRA
jgi:hypothetical protein